MKANGSTLREIKTSDTSKYQERDGTKCTSPECDSSWSQEFKAEFDEDKGTAPHDAYGEVWGYPSRIFLM